MKNLIEITGVDLVAFTRDVYDLSKPQGLGLWHARPGDLPQEDAQQCVDIWKDDTAIALSLDYLVGRACKMTVFRQGGKLWINDCWYDHTDEQLRELLSRHGKTPVEA